MLLEGVKESSITVTGNTVIDSLLSVIDKLNNNLSLKHDLDNRFKFLSRYKKLILVTSHRRESFGDGFESICKAIKEIVSVHKDVEIIYPVHPNPKVSDPIRRILFDIKGVYLIEPQEYLPFVYLMNRSYLIITDSGGVQEEAPSLGKPVLVMRDITERPEAVDAGTVKLVGTDCKRIFDEVNNILVNTDAYLSMSKIHNPYGDGCAAMRIVNSLL